MAIISRQDIGVNGNAVQAYLDKRGAARPSLRDRGASEGRRSRLFALATISAAVLVGLILRIGAAQGDLWLDELWSLDLVSRLCSPTDVFWAVPHDNNHPLNSFWLALLGPGQAPGLYRAAAVLFGTATILAAARLGWRQGQAAAVAAAILTAGAYPLVLYGSEARGYAGLILAVVLSIDLWSQIMDARSAGAPLAAVRPQCWALAATVLFGTLSHLTMLGEVAILGTATVLRRWSERGLLRALDEAVTLFRPVLLLLLPFCLLLAVGAIAKGGFVVGGVTPFAPERFVEGYGGLLSELLGLRTVAPLWCACPAAALLIGIGFAAGLIDRRFGSLAVASLVLLPTALFVARVGNTEFPRYFLVAGLILPVLMAEMAGRLWAAGGARRVAAVLLVGLPCLGQLPDVMALLKVHRGSPREALALVDAGATIRLRGDASFAASFVAAHYGAAGLHRFVAPGSPVPCGAVPEWLILDSADADAAPEHIIDGGPLCPAEYARRDHFATALWSGRAWTVYRRDP